MKSDPKAQRTERALKLHTWLQRRLRGEMWQQIFEGYVFFALGTALLIIPFLASFFLLSFSRPVPPHFGIVYASLFFGSFLGYAYITRSRVEPGGLVDRPWLASSSAIIFSAPEQYRIGISSFSKAVRLQSCDIRRVSLILLWLYDLRHKVTVTELCAFLADANVVRILPQLRDISGVIWLTYHQGVVMLSPEMRREIALALGSDRGPMFADFDPFEHAGEERRGSGKQSKANVSPGSAEKIQWYETLNLPPFAPLAAVKKRYRELVKIYHPDAMASRKGGAAVSDYQIKRINEAYHKILENSRRVRK